MQAHKTDRTSRPDVVVNAKDNRIEIVQIVREHGAAIVRDVLNQRNQTVAAWLREARDEFNTFRKNGSVRLTRFFATCSGVPQATTSPPFAPASGPRSTM